MKHSFQSVDQVDDVYVDHMSVTSEDTSSVILLTDRFENYENLNKEYIAFKEIGLLGSYRGYYVAAWRYKISLLVLKNISRVSAARKYFFATKGAIDYVAIVTVIFSHVKITCYFHV